jgi:osmotically-inducible protein OsmY
MDRALLEETSAVPESTDEEKNVMKRVIWSIACVFALYGAGPLFASSAVPQDTTAKTPDKTIDKRIEQRVNADASLKNFHLKVSVDDGIATLTGAVATEAQRARAESLANVRGVTRVDNQIVVDAYAGTKGTMGKLGDKTKEGAEKTKEGAETVGEKTKEGAENVGEKTKQGLSKAGEEITDTWITGHVKERFMGVDVLKGSDIDVTTENHVVTLKGTVASAAARTHAVQLARATQGVTRVVNRLTIAPR